MNINTRLRMVTALSAGVVVLFFAIAVLAMRKTAWLREEESKANTIARAGSELNALTYDCLLSGTARAQRQWRMCYNQLGPLLVPDAFTSAAQKLLVRAVIERYEVLDASFRRLLGVQQAAGSGAPDPVLRAELEHRLTGQLLQDSGQITVLALRLGEECRRAMVSAQRRANLMYAVILLLLLGVVTANAASISRCVGKPIARLHDGAGIIGAGNLDHRLGTDARDEIGDLSRTFDRMVQNLKRVMASRDALDLEVRQRESAEENLKQTLGVLERSNRELGEFAYVASHDLQEPLRKISAFSSLLVQECGAAVSADGREYLEHILRAVNRMQALINDLLELSRVATRAKPFSPVDMNATLREVLEDLDARLKESGGTVTVEPLPVLDADAIQMRQLFQNLIANSLKFRKPGEAPAVHVKVLETDENANRTVLGVEDNGIGFEPRFEERIFGLFQRLHGRQEYEGTGIGLAVCRRIVERHGGRITAEGRPGDGATFRLELPIKHARLQEGGAT